MQKGFSKYIILAVAILALAALVIAAVILFDAMDLNGTQTPATQMLATDSVANTPVPTFTSDTTIAPIVTVPVTDEPTATPYITPIVLSEGDTVWINLSYLKIRAQPDFALAKIGNIPYGEKVSGEIDGNWMYLSYEGTVGYIYVGKMEASGRPCVVFSYGALQPLD